jgi:hypothetical protein
MKFSRCQSKEMNWVEIKNSVHLVIDYCSERIIFAILSALGTHGKLVDEINRIILATILEDVSLISRSLLI